MALTPYYGLSYFGGNTPGTLADDGAKFTGADRVLLDRMLHALASSHRHLREYQSVSDPGTPVASVGSDGGLPAGTTYHYVVTYIDEDGLESLPSAEVTVSTPTALDPPDAPTLTDEDEDTGVPFGGDLPPGLYFYAITALRGDEESILSPQVSITTVDEGSSVQVTLPTAPEVGLEAQVWRMAAADVGWTRLGVVTWGEGTTYLDDGSIAANLNADDPTQAPPATNSGQDIYSVTVSLAVADRPLATGNEIAAWRLYRTETSGAWPAAALVQHVVDRVDPAETGDPSLPLVYSWKDDGAVLLDGLPPTTSQAMQLAPFVFDHVVALPDPTSYPQWYPVLYGGVLYVKSGSAWTAIGGGGGGGGGGGTQLSAQETVGQTEPLLVLKDDAGTNRFQADAAPDLPGDAGGSTDLYVFSRDHSNYFNAWATNDAASMAVSAYAPGVGLEAQAYVNAGAGDTTVRLSAEATQTNPLAKFEVGGATVFEVGVDGAPRLRSPDGTLHALSMSDAGVLGVVDGPSAAVLPPLIFAQDDPSTSWVIAHTFPYFPAVSITDSSGDQVCADVHHIAGQVTISADVAFAGVARLS